MTFSERDKKLLWILLVVLVACAPFILLIRPMMDKCEALTSQVTQLKNQRDYLYSLALAEDTYLEEMEKAEVTKQKLLDKFPSDILQEATLLFIDETEKKIPISLYQMGFGDNVAAQMTSAPTQEAIDEVEAATGDDTSDGIYEENAQEQQVAPGLTGLSTTIQFSYEANYEEFKEFLNYIKEGKDRMVITQLTAGYAEELDLVSGSFTLAQYAIKGEGRLPVAYLEPNMMLGSNNIFMQATGIFTGNEDTSDFFLMLNQPQSNEDAIVWGRTLDVTEETYLSSDKNAKQEATITFTGAQGNYMAQYSIGDETLEGDGISFVADDNISLEVLSSVRADENDIVEVNLNIINETDKIVYLSVLNDDETTKRVNIKGKTGDIFTR